MEYWLAVLCNGFAEDTCSSSVLGWYTRIVRSNYLLRTEVCIALPHLAWPPLDDCIAEHCDHHHKQEVTGVHQVQIYQGAVIIWHYNS